MSTHSESATFKVAITLMTEDGELPSEEGVAALVRTQMAGELDEETGLFCAEVVVKGWWA